MGWNNISQIANELAPEVQSPAVLIGHSMGGLIARKIAQDKLVSGKGSEIKGVITIGTPNQGAPVLLAVDAANKLLQGLLGSLTAIPMVMTGAISGDMNRTFNSYIEMLSKLGIQQAIRPAGRDMIPGSDFLNSLNTASAALPTISIVGSEGNPKIWKLLSSMENENDLGNLDDDQKERNVIRPLIIALTARGSSICNASCKS